MFSSSNKSKRPSKTQTLSGRTIIKDYAKFLTKKPTKKALLSYLTDPVLADLRNERTVRFSNSGIALSWVEVLNKLGYSIDVIDWDNQSFVPKDKYNLVVLHGGKNGVKILDRIGEDVPIIYFATGSYWKFNNSQEDKRLLDFAKRHNVRLPRDRFVTDPEEDVNRAADGIIVLGDASMKKTFPKYLPQVFTINNASYPDKHFNPSKKDYEQARKNFLFFAGSGNIHKGLDLLIDSFKTLDEHLYIVTVLDKKVMSAMKETLKQPNIHIIGQLEMRTKEFYDVMDSCGFVILPSCSEGQAGSVVECMNQGLIPIISKETRLDPKAAGTILKNNSISTIRSTVRSHANLSAREVKRRSKQTRRLAKSQHSPRYFKKELKRLIKQIINESPKHAK